MKVKSLEKSNRYIDNPEIEYKLIDGEFIITFIQYYQIKRNPLRIEIPEFITEKEKQEAIENDKK